MSNRDTRPCPFCGDVAERSIYDIGDGPELCCVVCDMCWGAHGQPLSPIPPASQAWLHGNGPPTPESITEWGVRWRDGSVTHRWNGRTAREHATRVAAEYRDSQLVCRLRTGDNVTEWMDPEEGADRAGGSRMDT